MVEKQITVDHHADAEGVSRRDVAALVLGAFGLTALVGCAADASAAAEGKGQSAAALTGGNFLWADTISDLRLLFGTDSGTAAKPVAVLGGYYAPTDGGGGLFYWDASSSTGDDGGTIIVPSGSATGRWKRIYSGALNVRWFGASGRTSDGGAISDDGAAIQAALDAASLAAGEVYIPAGVYGVQQNLGLTGARGVCVFGDGVDATTIRDLRAKTGTSTATAAYYGLFSHVSCSNCTLRDLTLQGANGPTVDRTQGATSGAARKATYAHNSSRTTIERIRATQFEDEGIYADGDSPQWSVIHCQVDNTTNNCINLNSSYLTSKGSKILFNTIDTYANSAIQVASADALVQGNSITNPYATGASVVVLDQAGSVVFIDNRFFNVNTTWAGVGIVDVYNAGTTSSASWIMIARNVFEGVTGAWESAAAAAIHVYDFGGIMVIADNVFSQCGRSPSVAANARAISIAGATPADISIHGNRISKGSGLNLDIGVYVTPEVPAGKVKIGTNYFTGGVATPHVVAGKATTARRQQAISATGVQTVLDSTETCVITVGGAVTTMLPDAVKVGAGKELVIKNGAAQVGTTTVSAIAPQTLDGAGSVTLSGAYHWLRMESDGANWMLVGQG